MISGPKSPGSFSVGSFRPVSTESQTPAVGGQSQAGLKELQSALKELSSNPILRSLLGESGFDGVKGKGHGHAHKGHGHKAEKADKAEKSDKGQASSEEGIKKLVDGLKKFVQLLEQMLGKKNETQDGTQGAEAGKSTGGTEGAGGSEAASGASGASGADAAQASGGSQGADAAQAADGADQAEESKDPISQLMDTLKKIITQLEQLMASLSKQSTNQNPGVVPSGATQTGNTGVVGPAATEV